MVLKVEHEVADSHRKVESTNKRLETFENLMKRSDEINNDLLQKQEAGEVTFADLTALLTRNIEELHVKMVEKDTFLDL